VKPFRYGILDPRPYYYLLVGVIILTIIFAKRLENSRVGPRLVGHPRGRGRGRA